MSIIIDPGHGPGSVNRGPAGYFEHVGMWKLSNFLLARLTQAGVAARLTRTEQGNPSLAARGALARGATVFVSQHSNGFNGQVRGCEVFHSVRRPNDRAIAAQIAAVSAALMGNPNRGAKVRESATARGQDHFGVIRAAVAAGAKHVFLCETGFHDNVEDERWLLVDANLARIADAQARILIELLK